MLNSNECCTQYIVRFQAFQNWTHSVRIFKDYPIFKSIFLEESNINIFDDIRYCNKRSISSCYGKKFNLSLSLLFKRQIIFCLLFFFDFIKTSIVCTLLEYCYKILGKCICRSIRSVMYEYMVQASKLIMCKC